MAAALLEPALLRRLESLALRVRRAVSGQMGGERRSRRRGQSVEFADFRNYTPGDDFRLIDWNAYARLDRFMLRLFTAEEELPLSPFVDLSGSMDWGTPNKAVTARRLAGAIAYVALVALDRVRLTVFADGPTSGGAPYRGRRAAAQLFARLQSSMRWCSVRCVAWGCSDDVSRASRRRPGPDDPGDRRALLSEDSAADPDRARPASVAQPDPRPPGQCAMAAAAPELAAVSAAA